LAAAFPEREIIDRQIRSALLVSIFNPVCKMNSVKAQILKTSPVGCH